MIHVNQCDLSPRLGKQLTKHVNFEQRFRFVFFKSYKNRTEAWVDYNFAGDKSFIQLRDKNRPCRDLLSFLKLHDMPCEDVLHNAAENRTDRLVFFLHVIKEQRSTEAKSGLLRTVIFKIAIN